MSEPAQNIPSSFFTPEGLVLSDRYSEVMEKTVRPYIDSRRTDETVSCGGCGIFTSRFTPEGKSRGTVMIVHGFTENTEKYAEIIHSLLRCGWSVLAYDQRGHGRSWRKPGVTDLSLTHVDRFEDYAEDMRVIADRPLMSMPAPRMLFCHSMGGAVSAMYLENNPCPFERAVFSSPMIAPNVGGIPVGAVRVLCRVPVAMGRGASRAFISHPYSGPERFEGSCASGRERFEWYESLRCAVREFQNNGPSYAWALESVNVTKKLLAPGMPEKILIPVRVYGAEQEGSVVPEAQETFVRRLKNGVREVVPGSRHEIYRSPDSVLFPWWRGVLAFFAGGEAGMRQADIP